MEIATPHNICKQVFTAKSYVQDDLAVLFDAIENLGYGQHDHTSSTWKSCVGPMTAKINPQNWRNGDRIYDVATANVNATNPSTLSVTGDYTWEATMDEINSTSWNGYVKSQETGIQIIKQGSRAAIETSYGKILDPSCRTVSMRLARDSNGTATISVFENGKQTYSKSGITPKGGTVTMYQLFRAYGTSGGIFYRFAFWNRALTDKEIARNYEIDKVRFGI